MQQPAIEINWYRMTDSFLVLLTMSLANLSRQAAPFQPAQEPRLLSCGLPITSQSLLVCLFVWAVGGKCVGSVWSVVWAIHTSSGNGMYVPAIVCWSGPVVWF